MWEVILQLSHQKILGNGKANYTGYHFVMERETKEDLKTNKQKNEKQKPALEREKGLFFWMWVFFLLSLFCFYFFRFYLSVSFVSNVG